MGDIIPRFVADLRALGITPGDTLLVHSSLKSLGYVEGGAETVIDALLAALPEGTLLLPALSWEAVNEDNPRFSARHTPGCVGLIPETFRARPGVIRSVHPTHSVCAYGARAEALTRAHRLDRTPVGENSPFRLLTGLRGKLLMLGCGLRPNTFMHGAEEAAGVPYVLKDTPMKVFIEDADGNTEEVYHYRHNFGDRIEQRYDRVTDCVTPKRGKVLDADAFVLDAFDLWEAAAQKLAVNPWFFVDGC